MNELTARQRHLALLQLERIEMQMPQIAQWDQPNADPRQDFVDAFWPDDPNHPLYKYTTEFIKKMVPEEYWLEC